MVSCVFCRRRIWYRRDLSNPFARNKEKTYAYECYKCQILLMLRNMSARKTRGSKAYWENKTIVKGKVIRILATNLKANRRLIMSA